MMATTKRQLIIVLDSSVSQKGGNTGVGAALCLWVAYPYDPADDNHPISQKLPIEERYKNAILMEALDAKSIRSGSIYNSVDGPTKIFYDGIIRAMQSCYYLLKKEEISKVIVLGDCEHAVEQLNGNRKVDKMQPLYNQVQKLREDYGAKGVEIEFCFIKECEYSLYKKIDAMAKEMRAKISKMFNHQ